MNLEDFAKRGIAAQKAVDGVISDCSQRETAELWRQTKAMVTLTIAENQLGEFRSSIDEARQWLREGAPGKALEVLDAAKERLNHGN